MEKKQRKYYNIIKKQLEQLGLFDQADDLVLQDAARCRVLIDEAEEIVNSMEGNARHLQVFPTGATQISPAMNNLRGHQADWRAYCSELGLSPKARKSMDTAKSKPAATSRLMQIKNRKIG